MATPFKPLPFEEVIAVHKRLLVATRQEGFDDFISLDAKGSVIPRGRTSPKEGTRAAALLSALQQASVARARVLRSATAESWNQSAPLYQVLDDKLRDRGLQRLKKALRELEGAARDFTDYSKNVLSDVHPLPILPPVQLAIGKVATTLADRVRRLVAMAQTNETEQEPTSLDDWERLLGSMASDLYNVGFTDRQIAGLLLGRHTPEDGQVIWKKRKRSTSAN